MFKCDTETCKEMPYINLCEHMDGFALIDTIEDNIENECDENMTISLNENAVNDSVVTTQSSTDGLSYDAFMMVCTKVYN